MNKLIKIVLNEFAEWYQVIFIRNIPGNIGAYVRYLFWRKHFKKCGDKLIVRTGFFCGEPGNISVGNNAVLGANIDMYAINGGKIQIGNRFSANKNCMIDASENGSIIIGDNVLLARNVTIRSSDHVFSRLDIPIRDQGHRGGEIIIGNDVWIAANAVILPDVNIGYGCVIGAGCVVTNDIPPLSIVAGVPGKIIGTRAVSDTN
ncbi:MAG: acyltransferase [Syntrophomonadaceae bacterium]|nr:acyltransferase [Syntrophomonadaceae bacterium]